MELFEELEKVVDEIKDESNNYTETNETATNPEKKEPDVVFRIRPKEEAKKVEKWRLPQKCQDEEERATDSKKDHHSVPKVASQWGKFDGNTREQPSEDTIDISGLPRAIIVGSPESGAGMLFMLIFILQHPTDVNP